MTKSEIRRRIYLTGSKTGGYKVVHNMPGECIVCHVPSTKIGNCIVRALREMADRDRKSL